MDERGPVQVAFSVVPLRAAHRFALTPFRAVGAVRSLHDEVGMRRSMTTAWSLVALGALALMACGSDGDGGSGGAGGTSGSGGALNAGQCRQTSDCTQMGDTCVPPGFDIGCGACQDPPMDELCTDDAECKAQGASYICAPVACSCSGPANTCAPGCTSDAECAAHLECDATNRCSAKSCSGDGDCPANYSCADGACARRPCVTDVQCDDGYCVGGTCFADPGWCWDGVGPP